MAIRVAKNGIIVVIYIGLTGLPKHVIIKMAERITNIMSMVDTAAEY